MSRSIGRYLVELLAVNGIDTVFGIPGVHNLELYRGLADSSLRHVLVRHEQGAGFAADGYARMSGRPAAAFTISGPGLTNILTAVAQAYSDSIPLLVVATTPVRASLGKQWGVLHELAESSGARIAGVSASRAAHDCRGCARPSARVPRSRCGRDARAPRTSRSPSTCCPRRRLLAAGLASPAPRLCRRRRPRKSTRAVRLLADALAARHHRGRGRAARRPANCGGSPRRSIVPW